MQLRMQHATEKSLEETFHTRLPENGLDRRDKSGACTCWFTAVKLQQTKNSRQIKER